MSDDQARSLSGLRILVLDQDRARGDALASLLREAGAEAGTVPEGVEPAIVIAESVPDGIVIDRATPATDPVKLRSTLESDTFLRSIVIVPGVLGDAMKDGAMALKRLVAVRLTARLALAKSLEGGNEAEGSVTDVGPGAIVRLAARAPYGARVEVTVGPRLITVSTADGLLLGVTEAIGGKVTQRGLDALAALLMSDGGKFRITKETKGPVGNLVGEPDEHLRNAAAMSRRTTTRPPSAGAGASVPRIPEAGRAPAGVATAPARDPALGRTMHMGSPAASAPAASRTPSAPVPASPRAVVALSDNPRPLGRTLVGVPAQSAGTDSTPRAVLPRPGDPRPAVATGAPQIPVPRAARPAVPAPEGHTAPVPAASTEPAGPLPTPREPLARDSRPGPIRSKTLLGMAAPVLPGKAIVAPATTSAPVLDPITSKVETPAEVLVRSKPTELDDDVATDRLEKRAVRAPAPSLEAGDRRLADGNPLTDSGGDLPTVIGPRPDVIATIADALPSSPPATTVDAKPSTSPSVVPVRSIVIDDAVTVPRSRALPDVDATASATPDIEGPTVPRSPVKPEAAPSPDSARESFGNAATIMAMPTPARPPTSPVAQAATDGAPATTAEMVAPGAQMSTGTAEMVGPSEHRSTGTAEMVAPPSSLGSKADPAASDPLASTWAQPSPSRAPRSPSGAGAPAPGRKSLGPEIGHDEWTDGGGPTDLSAARPRPAEPAPSKLPLAAILGVVVLGVAVSVGALWALKVGPFAPAPIPEPPPTTANDEPPPPTEPSTPPATPGEDSDAGEAQSDAGEAQSDAGSAATAPTTPVEPPSTNPTEPQGGSESGDDSSGLRDAQQALARGDVRGAQAAMARLNGRERSSPHGESLQSQIAERQGDLDGAISHARRASSMRPGRSSYRTRLGELLLRAGAAGAARSEFEAALRTNPRDQNARRALERMGVTPPPAGGGTDTPPSGGTDTPPSGGTDTPPSGGTDTPPSGGTDTPPSGGTDTPPSGGADTPTPPPTPPPPGPPPAPPPPGDAPGSPP